MDTIYALSSGKPPAGIAVIRLSGPDSRFALETFCGKVPVKKQARLSILRDPQTGTQLDEGLILWFEGPGSFTGEDVVEFHCHGGIAVVNAVLESLSQLSGFRYAEAGEFTRRAFYNRKIDLVSAEGLGDLIHAETESQRILAQSQMMGTAAKAYDLWRFKLINLRALIEAELDFSEEDDVPGSVSEQVWNEVQILITKMVSAIENTKRAERIRDGVNIVLAGVPNAGKSSLLNALSKREVAIVTDLPGTTRDVLDVFLNLDGVAVRLSDTAGLRHSVDVIEVIGIERAEERIQAADIVLLVIDVQDPNWEGQQAYLNTLVQSENLITIATKIDLLEDQERQLIRSRFNHAISSQEDIGITNLLEALSVSATRLTAGETMISARARHQAAIVACIQELQLALEDNELEIRAEYLRKASDALGRITGSVDVEDLLDVVFRQFCIGK